MKKFLLIALFCLSCFTLCSCEQFFENPTKTETKETETMNTEPTKVVEPDIDLALFKNASEIRLSSFCTGSEGSKKFYLKQIAPYDDTYKIETNSYTTYELYDSNGVLIAVIKPNEKKSLDFKKDELIYAVVSVDKDAVKIGFDITLTKHESLFPYDPINLVDAESLLADSKKNIKTVAPAEVSYTKREGGLYINCNNPERLTPECINTALTRNDVSNKEVFFTFEHNNSISGPFYYGYQVINRGEKDVYITVKNIGYQVDGPGSWLGEKEWTDFYNTEFRIKGLADFTESQMNNFIAFYNFCNTYKSPNYQPVTYRIPAGEHIYVMGGTTADAYENINVFDTANKKVNGGCSNGAVLFEVIGDNVEAAFYVYKDYKKVQSDNKTHQGYVTSYPNDTHNYGSQYVGYDNCHGVVDAYLTWEFNDHIKQQFLPITFTNYYADDVVEPGTPYGKINSTAHVKTSTKWATHINPQNNHSAVGTDMTKYYTINEKGEEICIDSDHYDGLGNKANIGNWMIDYMENYTFVNHGNTERKLFIKFTNNGSVAVLVRDADGNYI